MKCHRPSAPRLERPHPLEPRLFLSRFLPSPSPRLLRPAPLPAPARVSTAGDEELEDPIAPPLRGGELSPSFAAQAVPLYTSCSRSRGLVLCLLAGLGFSRSGFWVSVRFCEGAFGSGTAGLRLRGCCVVSRPLGFRTSVRWLGFGFVFWRSLLLKWRCIADDRSACILYCGLDISHRDRQAIELRICGKK